MASSTGLVSLECGHTRTFRPSPPVAGETVFCSSCPGGAYQRVVSTLRQIRLSCSGCKYGRTMGVGGETDLTTRDAFMVASKHVLRFPSHSVTITDSDGILKTISNSASAEDMLPLEGLVEQRVADNKEHQASLRRLW